MLDHYLNVVTVEMQKAAALADFTERLTLLPASELAEIQRTGEIKLAFCDEEWLQKFHGSPLSARAIDLATKQLEMEAERNEMNRDHQVTRDEFNQQEESLRLEKRLLELELAKADNGIAATPPPVPKATNPDVAPGPLPTEAPSPAAPAVDVKVASLYVGVGDRANKKAAEKNPYDDLMTSPSGQAALMAAGIHGGESLLMGRGAGRSALSALGGYMTGRTAGEIGERSETMGGSALGGAVSSALPAFLMSSRPGTHLLTSAAAGAYAHHKSKKKEASFDAETWGRNLARTELEHVKTAADMKSIGQSMLTFAKKNPALVAGGALGVAHGAMREDGGLGSAILEGVGGAALGHGGQALYNRLGKKGLPGSGMLGGAAPAQLMPPGAPVSMQEPVVAKVASIDKEALGALLAAGAKALPGLATGAANWLKSNPLKAGMGAVSALSNYSQARQQGQGMASSLLAGAGGAAGAAL